MSTCFGGKHLISQSLSHESQLLLSQIQKVKKTTSFAYQLLCDTVHVAPKAQQKWTVEFNKMPGAKEMIWKVIYVMPYKCTFDTKTHYLQYRFIHRILPTNTFLCRIGLIDDNKCTFCKNEEETMKHLMWSCEYVSKLWNDVHKWLTDLNIQVTITYWKVCFGV